MNQDLRKWDEIAKEWTKEIEPKRLFRPILVQDSLNKLLGNNLEGKKILDAGCGDGVHAKFLSDMGAEVVGIDGSENMLKLAGANYPKIAFQKVDLLESLPFADNEFDYVVSILVFMSLDNISVFLSEAHRVLKREGKLIFLVHHPAFGNTAMKLYKTLWDKLLGRKPKGLIETYYPGTRVKRNNERGATKDIPYYHRTLEDYSLELSRAHFYIKQLLEPHELPKEFLAQSPKLEYVTRLPRFIVFDCIKQ